jgi:hypothetical protein
MLTASLCKSVEMLCNFREWRLGRTAAMARISALDQPGVAHEKLRTGTLDLARNGTMQPTSSSTLGACHASVIRSTGRPGTRMGARRREPMKVFKAGKALGASENV